MLTLKFFRFDDFFASSLTRRATCAKVPRRAALLWFQIMLEAQSDTLIGSNSEPISMYLKSFPWLLVVFVVLCLQILFLQFVLLLPFFKKWCF